MSTICVGIDVEVQCTDGCKYAGVTFFVKENRRVFIDADGNELEGVECVTKCISVLPPMALMSALSRCPRCD